MTPERDTQHHAAFPMGARSFPLLLAGLLALAAGGAGADERWLEVRSAHFRVITDASERDGRAVVTGFEQLRSLFATIGRLRVDPPAPVVVVAARNEAGLRSFLPSFWERRGGVRPAGVHLGGTDKHHIALRLDVERDLRDDVVYHEYVHLVLRLNFPGLPLWLNEGLAEFYAGTKVEGDRVVYGRVNVQRLRVLRQRSPMPLTDLLAVDGSSREYNEESRASILYAQSALLTHYLMVGDKGAHRGKLVQYLDLLSRGVPAEEAQGRAFGEIRALERKFFAYLRRRGFLALTMPIDLSASTAAVRSLSAAEAMAVRGDFLARHDSPEEARALLAKAREMDPNLPLAAQAMGVLEARAGRPAEARRHLADAIRLAADDFASHYLWAEAMPLSEDTDLDAREGALRRSLQLNPSFAPAHALLSHVLRARGQVDQALLSLHEACELEPANATYWLQRADLLRERKRPDVADQIETQLARLAPSDPSQLRALAAYYREANRPDDLERLLRRASDLNPRSALAPLMLGHHLHERGRDDEAEAAYRQALAAQPENPAILNALAYHSAERGVKLPEALKLVERALKAYPENGAILDTKGWVLFRMGRLEDAEKFLRRALEDREDPEVLEHLGDVIERRGRQTEARQTWQRALEHEAASEDRKEALRRKLASRSSSPAEEDETLPAADPAGPEPR